MKSSRKRNPNMGRDGHGWLQCTTTLAGTMHSTICVGLVEVLRIEIRTVKRFKIGKCYCLPIHCIHTPLYVFYRRDFEACLPWVHVEAWEWVSSTTIRAQGRRLQVRREQIGGGWRVWFCRYDSPLTKDHYKIDQNMDIIQSTEWTWIFFI